MKEYQDFRDVARAAVESISASVFCCWERELHRELLELEDQPGCDDDETAAALDARAAAEGVESIAPLYGLCIPMKGTAAVVDFPAGSGVGVLSGYTPLADSDLTQLIRQRNGIIFGCTNVPEFAANWVH